MNIVLLRVGIDTGCGGILGPLFSDGTFEFVPIPDEWRLDERTYGNTVGRHGRRLVEYFPSSRHDRMTGMSMHVDPEFGTFTYGDPTPPKRGLARLQSGDLLVFYAGLEGWGCPVPPALYLVGLFEVALCGFAESFTAEQLREQFSNNFHVRHPSLFAEQRDRLLLIKGGPRSRLFQKAVRVGQAEKRADGSVWQLISPEMAEVFGRFGGIGSIQRSNPRWVEQDLAKNAAQYVRRLM